MNGSFQTFDHSNIAMARPHDIECLEYQPQGAYALDVEVFTMAELRQRGSREKVRTTHRYGFHMLACVTQGVCKQVIDFRPVVCAPGSLLVVRQGQAHNFGPHENWDGWIVLFRPEFVLPPSVPMRQPAFAADLVRLPEHMPLDNDALDTVTRALAQMREDSQLQGPLAEVKTLLLHQLHALLTRLGLLHGPRSTQEALPSPALQRFQRFQQLVEERFTRWHQVARYAQHLGCTEKSLARASATGSGITAKAFIAARIALEAKRLLVHTNLTVASIADRLGFDEPTNFGKFFRREAGCTPAEFRRQQLDATVLPG